MTKTYCFWFKFCCLFSLATAQQVENAFHWQSESLLSFQSMAFSEENTFVGGIFQEELEQIEAIGGSDIFLAQLDENGTIIWLQTGGSTANDELAKIISTDDHLYTTGTYWIEGQFGEIQLRAKKGSKSIFLLNYSTQGKPKWGVSIGGTANKSVNDLVVDYEGNLLLAGSFRDSLFFEDQAILFSAQQSFFLIKLDQNGNLIWSKQADLVEGKTESVALGISKENEIVLTGNFVGKMQIEETEIETNTEDENVFTAQFSKDGNFLWLQAAGGVFPDEVADIQYFGNQIYLVGNYFGRLQMDENITIESRGLNENIFLLTYDQDGQALSAKNIGDVDSENVTSLDIIENQIVLGGFFRERMKVGDFTISGDENALDGFILAMDLEANPVWLRALDADENLLVNETYFRSATQIQAIGDFKGKAQFDDFRFETNTFNPFLVNIKNPITSTSNQNPHSIDFQVISFLDRLQVLTNEPIQLLQIFDLQGKLLYAQKQADQISTASLQNGIYLLLLQTKNGIYASQLFTKLN